MSDTTVAIELQPALNALSTLSEQSPPLTGANLGFYRKRSKLGTCKPLTNVSYKVVDIPEGNGYRGYRIWLINLNAATIARPALVHFHGGGFVMGDCKNSLPRMQQLALDTDTLVASIEYGLAPEVKVHESLLQNYAALRWLFEHAQSLNVDPDKIGLLGISAGGGHAALLAQKCVKEKAFSLACQILVYPMLDDATGTTVTPPPHQGQYVWTAEQNYYGWQAFLGKTPGSKKIPKEWVPARAEDLVGLPPTFIGVGDLDLFFNENVATLSGCTMRR